MCAALQVGNATSTIRRGIAAMPCEFEGTESYTGKDKLLHTKQICTGNLLPCLVDTPMGHVACTRRTWLLLQGWHSRSEAAKGVPEAQGVWPPGQASIGQDDTMTRGGALTTTPPLCFDKKP